MGAQEGATSRGTPSRSSCSTRRSACAAAACLGPFGRASACRAPPSPARRVRQRATTPLPARAPARALAPAPAPAAVGSAAGFRLDLPSCTPNTERSGLLTRPGDAALTPARLQKLQEARAAEAKAQAHADAVVRSGAMDGVRVKSVTTDYAAEKAPPAPALAEASADAAVSPAFFSPPAGLSGRASLQWSADVERARAAREASAFAFSNGSSSEGDGEEMSGDGEYDEGEYEEGEYDGGEGGYDDGEYDNAGNEPEPALETRQQQQQQQQQQLAEGAAQLPTAATTYATTTPAVPTRAGRPSLSFKTIGRSLSFSRGRTERAKHKTKAQDVHSSASGSGAAPR